MEPTGPSNPLDPTKYEKLGAFYLGRVRDVETDRTTDDLLLYDSRDLTTHAVCVGMTGSGKTGLCVSLCEEAAIDGIPVIAIDPKGDLGNLLLTFPDLHPADFEPWVDPDDAARQGRSPAEHAAAQAAMWRDGLASWGQDGARIRRLRESAEFAIYTPGSESGLPVSILDSFAAPPPGLRADPDGMRDRITGTTTALLGLLGCEADPIRSRDHILIATLMDRFWKEGRDLDPTTLIQAIQSPPMKRVGVIAVESFYPEKDRFALSMRVNNLLAAPGFQAWMSGQRLDVADLLHTPEGKPRCAIFSISHLTERERMFFVSLLLNQVIGWMRSRPGTSSLRAMVYMDECFGYLPPTAAPPSKKPLLTLLKQARAYGVGVVLATQNPVDLDYKGLSNCGTWFLGRLQTERDKERLIDGLEGASPGRFDRQRCDRILSGLDKRIFMMHNVHDDGPVVFESRWALSYLRGPLARDQIRRLTEGRAVPAPAPAPDIPDATAAAPAASTFADPPLLPPEVPQVFLPCRASEGSDVRYEPRILGLARVQYVDAKTRRMKHSEDFAFLLRINDGIVDADWEKGERLDLFLEDLEDDPVPATGFADVPAEATRAASYPRWRRTFEDTLYRTARCDLHRSVSLGILSEPGESERDFRIRCGEAGRERRDRVAEDLRAKYARRLARLEERLRRAKQAVARESEQASGQTIQTAISFGATVLSALMGRKAMSYGTLGRATTTMRGAGRMAKERQDVARARENTDAIRDQMGALERELNEELDRLEARMDPLTEDLETTSLRPRRGDVEVRLVALAWVPFTHAADGTLTPGWR